MFKTRTPRPGSVPAWIPLVVLLVGVGLLQFLRCAPTQSRMERRRDAFVEVARLVNDPVRELQPLHFKIFPEDQGAIVLLDAQLKACAEARPIVERLSSLSFPLDEMGRPLSSGDGLRDATSTFLAGRKECDAAGAAPEVASSCLLRCMGDWRTLVFAVDKMRKDAVFVGVRVESIAPLVKVLE